MAESTSTVYEGMFILDSNAYARDGAVVANQIHEFIEKHGGEMLASRLWEERRLAYPIDGHKKGTYWLTYFSLPGKAVAAVERDVEISDTILRSLILKIDPRLVDMLVSHARGEAVEA